MYKCNTMMIFSYVLGIAPLSGFETAHSALQGAIFCPVCLVSRIQYVLIRRLVPLVLINPFIITWLIGNFDRQSNTPDLVNSITALSAKYKDHENRHTSRLLLYKMT